MPYFCHKMFRLQLLRAAVLLTVVGSISETKAQRSGRQKRAGGQVTTDSHKDGLSGRALEALNQAVAALQTDSLAAAEQAARIAVAAAPRSAATHNVLGVVLDRRGQADEAFAEFNTAVKLDPGFTSAHNNLGRVLADRGQSAAAIAQFETVLKTDPSHVQAHYNLGALYADAGDYVKAAEHFARAREAQPDDPRLGIAFVNVAYRANRGSDADATVEWLERKFAGQPQGLFTLATVLAQNGQYERAATLFAQVNVAMPHTYEILYNLGLAFYNLDRSDEASRYLAEAADLNPDPPETHFRLGLIASARNDEGNAIEEFRHAIERDGKNANYHYLLGREFFRAGIWDEAIKEYSVAIALDPKQSAYVLARANASYRKGEWVSAAADFDMAASLDPNIKDIEYLRGYAHRAAGDFDAARQLLEKFLATHPDHVDALASLGYVAVEQGRLEDAEAPLTKALRLEPDNVPVLYDYARLAIKKRDYDQAVIRLQRVIERNPTQTQAHYQLFLAYSRLKQPDKAATELTEFKRLQTLEKQATQERIMDEKLRVQRLLGSSPQ